MSSSSNSSEFEEEQNDDSNHPIGLCKQCGLFGPLYENELCRLCYNDHIDQINSPSQSDDDSVCEKDDPTTYSDTNEIETQHFSFLVHASTKYDFHGEPKECPICLEKLKDGDEVISLPCAHTFHFQCITSWLSEHDTCPLCRNPISNFNQSQK